MLFQHFTGTMDDWDQSMIEGLAKGRTVVILRMPVSEHREAKRLIR